MNRLFRDCLILLVFSSFLLADAQAADDLEREFQDVAPKILNDLRGRGIQTTGVLKFAVRIGEGEFPSSFGLLNIRLAEKLELALAMANPAFEGRRDQQVGIIRAASDVAATIDGATHLTSEGRKKLFSESYPLAWKFKGQSTVVPDSLIAGVAQIASSLNTMQIELVLITKNDLKQSSLARFTVPIDLEDLMESGQSFTTRGVFDRSNVNGTNAKARAMADRLVRKEALAIRNESLFKTNTQTVTQHPLAATSSSPVQLEIWYGNTRQDYEFRDGAAFVKTPVEGQEITLKVVRKGGDRKRYGVLLQVNGENTLYRQRKPAAQAALWIFEPKLDSCTVRGYQVDLGEREQFRVLSESESDARKFDYGRNVGLISMTVFEEDPRITIPPNEEELDLAVLSEASLPSKTLNSRGDLGSSLFAQLVAQKTRSVIAEGEKVESKIGIEKFKRHPTPVVNASVRYYTPTK